MILLAAGLLALGGVAHGAPRAGTMNLSNSPGPSTEPAVALADDGSTMAVWLEGDQLTYSRAVGGSWSTPKVVPAATGSGPRLAAAAGGAVDLVWSGFSELDGNFEIYHSRWSGGRWSLPVNVSASAGESLDPAIAVHPARGRLVVWSELDSTGAATVYAASSPDGGTWSSGPLPGAAGDDPRVSAGSGNVAWHVAWRASPDGSAAPAVLYAQRPTSGSWSLPEIVSGAAEPAVDALDLAVDSAAVVTWRAGNTLRVARRGSGDWTTWPIVSGQAGLGAPAIAAGNDGSATIAFTQASEVRQALLGPSGGPGATTLGTLTGGARHAAIARAIGQTAVLAEGGPGANAEVYLLGDGTPPTATATITPSNTPFPPTGTLPAVTHTPGASATHSATPSPLPSHTPVASATWVDGGKVRLYLPCAFRARR